jgi:hypothetical protein
MPVVLIPENLPRAVLYLIASVEGGAPNEIGPLKVDSGGNLLVNPSPSGNPLPPIPEIVDLAVHNFTAIQNATTYDPIPIDIDQVRNWGAWVQNTTGTTAISAVRATIYHLIGAGGASAITQATALPAWVGAGQFLVCNGFGGGWVFNDAIYHHENIYNSLKLGIVLPAGFDQQITVTYIGIR